MARKFQYYAANIGIMVQNTLVKVHHSISKVKHYHKSLQQVYSIIITEISGIKPNLILQMSFKAINDLVGFNGLVFTLLVFDSYPKITKQDAPFSSITKSALAMKKAINEVQKSTTFQQINNVFNT